MNREKVSANSRESTQIGETKDGQPQGLPLQSTQNLKCAGEETSPLRCFCMSECFTLLAFLHLVGIGKVYSKV